VPEFRSAIKENIKYIITQRAKFERSGIANYTSPSKPETGEVDNQEKLKEHCSEF